MPYCPNCGSKVEESEKFCRSCGTSQRTTPTNSTSQPARELNENIKLAEDLLKPASNPQPASTYQPTDEPLVPYDENIKLMKEFKNIVPEKLFNHVLEMYENPNPKNTAEIGRTLNELSSIYQNYLKMVRSPIGSIPDEQVLWIYEEQKGIFKKEVSKTWAITNLRVYHHDHETGLQLAKGVLLSDTEVMNLVRNSRGNRIGTYTTDAGAYGFDASTQRGDYSSGDLVFLFQGKETFRLTGITDPEGVLRLVENAKKQQHAALNR